MDLDRCPPTSEFCTHPKSSAILRAKCPLQHLYQYLRLRQQLVLVVDRIIRFLRISLMMDKKRHYILCPAKFSSQSLLGEDSAREYFAFAEGRVLINI